MTGVRAVSEQRAPRTTQIGPQLYHWWFADERIGGAQSDSYALYTRAGFIFVDPLPMMYVAADAFPAVGVAFLTRGCHQRACWRYQFEHGARVLSPRGSPGLGETAARVVARLAMEPSGADALARALELEAGELAAVLAELELSGAVSERDGFFRVARRLG